MKQKEEKKKHEEKKGKFHLNKFSIKTRERCFNSLIIFFMYSLFMSFLSKSNNVELYRRMIGGRAVISRGKSMYPSIDKDHQAQMPNVYVIKFFFFCSLNLLLLLLHTYG